MILSQHIDRVTGTHTVMFAGLDAQQQMRHGYGWRGLRDIIVHQGSDKHSVNYVLKYGTMLQFKQAQKIFPSLNRDDYRL